VAVVQYTFTHKLHRTTQSTQTIHRTTHYANKEECGPCPVFARYTLAFALQLRKSHEKTSVRVAGEGQLAKSIQNRAYLSIRIHKPNNKNNNTIGREGLKRSIGRPAYSICKRL
jgi:hypothetical protein